MESNGPITGVPPREIPGAYRGTWANTAKWVVICFTLLVLAGMIIVPIYLATLVHTVVPEVVKVDVKTAITTNLGEIIRSPKLVVLTVPVNVVIKRSNVATIFGMPLPFGIGITDILLVAAENKVQYIVHLDAIRESDFQYDESTKHLTVTVPEPVIDRGMVSIQNNPEKITVMTKGGFMTLDVIQGQHLREEAHQEIFSAVIVEASQPLIREEAQRLAVLYLQKLLTPVTRKLGENVEVEIKFR